MAKDAPEHIKARILADMEADPKDRQIKYVLLREDRHGTLVRHGTFTAAEALKRIMNQRRGASKPKLMPDLKPRQRSDYSKEFRVSCCATSKAALLESNSSANQFAEFSSCMMSQTNCRLLYPIEFKRSFGQGKQPESRTTNSSSTPHEFPTHLWTILFSTPDPF